MTRGRMSSLIEKIYPINTEGTCTAPSAHGPPWVTCDACPDQTFWTWNGAGIIDSVRGQQTAGACRALCAADTACDAWLINPDNNDCITYQNIPAGTGFTHSCVSVEGRRYFGEVKRTTQARVGGVMASVDTCDGPGPPEFDVRWRGSQVATVELDVTPITMAPGGAAWTASGCTFKYSSSALPVHISSLFPMKATTQINDANSNDLYLGQVKHANNPDPHSDPQPSTLTFNPQLLP